MPEGPMNIEPTPLDLEVETTADPAAQLETQQTGLTDISPNQGGSLPVAAANLSAGGRKTFNALRGKK